MNLWVSGSAKMYDMRQSTSLAVKLVIRVFEKVLCTSIPSYFVSRTCIDYDPDQELIDEFGCDLKPSWHSKRRVRLRMPRGPTLSGGAPALVCQYPSRRKTGQRLSPPHLEN